jgi:hypothetical protein
MYTNDQTREMMLTAIAFARDTDLPDSEIAASVIALDKIARRLHKLYEVYCEREMTPAEKREATTLESCAVDILRNKLGFQDFRFCGDPRGYPIQVKLPSGRSNSFGGDVWGIGL